MLIVDTGPLVAAADRSDRHHLACVELLETASGPLVTTAMVLAETAYLLTRELGPGAEPALYDAILDGGLTVEPVTSGGWRRIRDLVDAYVDMPLGGTIASISFPSVVSAGDRCCPLVTVASRWCVARAVFTAIGSLASGATSL